MRLKIGEMVGLLNAKVVLGEEMLDMQVNSACASDMMSDILQIIR